MMGCSPDLDRSVEELTDAGYRVLTKLECAALLLNVNLCRNLLAYQRSAETDEMNEALKWVADSLEGKGMIRT
jgi:hypothetical protein